MNKWGFIGQDTLVTLLKSTTSSGLVGVALNSGKDSEFKSLPIGDNLETFTLLYRLPGRHPYLYQQDAEKEKEETEQSGDFVKF